MSMGNDGGDGNEGRLMMAIVTSIHYACDSCLSQI